MFLQQQLRSKLLHFSLLAVSKVVAMGEDLPLELSGSDTDVSSDEIQATLLSAVAREANSRAGATFAEMMGRDLEHALVEETARPKLAAKPKSAAGWRASSPIDAAASSGVAAGSSSVASGSSNVEAGSSSVAASSSIVAAGSSEDRPCPLAQLLPIERHQVRLFMDNKGKVHYDTKTPPLPLPHPNMEFRGYVTNSDGSISALFTDKTRRGERGTRMPKKRAGGVNKRYFDGLKNVRTDTERAQYRRDCRNLYIPYRERYGPKDPEI